MRFCMSEMLLERHKKKSFLHRIVTGDEKWIHHDNPKRKKSYVKPGQPAKSTAKSNIHGTKVMLWMLSILIQPVYSGHEFIF